MYVTGKKKEEENQCSEKYPENKEIAINILCVAC